MDLDQNTHSPLPMRLDDLFRLLIHDRTLDLLRLVLPDLVSTTPLTRPIRLDTQSPLTQLLVDAAYVFCDERGPHLLLFEGQSRANQWREDRSAKLLHASIAQLSVEPLLAGIRLVEVRLRERATGQSPAGLFGSPGFAATNVLLEVDPDTHPFNEPEYWVFAAFSRLVDARWIAARVLEHRTISLNDPARGLLPADRLLLGLCGRARFPDSSECRHALEELMNEASKAALLPTPASNLTVEERHHLEVSILEAGREAARLRREKEEAHLIAGRAELEQGRAELRMMKEQLRADQEQLQAQFQEQLRARQEQLQTQLRAGQEQLQTQLRAGQEQLRAGQEQLQAGQEQLQAGREELERRESLIQQREALISSSLKALEAGLMDPQTFKDTLERIAQSLQAQQHGIDE